MTTPTDVWPVYTGKSFNLWDPDTGQYYASVDPEKIKMHLQGKRQNQYQNSRSAFSEIAEDTIDDPETLPCLHPRIVYRDVTNAVDARTVIAALAPPYIVSVDTAPYLLLIKGTERHEAFVLGVLCSMILDWYARTAVIGHVKFATLSDFPIPDADVDESPVAARVAEITGLLAAVDERYSEWADAVGVPVGSVTDPAEKDELIHELDACVALLYDLDEDDLATIYDTFHAKTDYSARHAAVLKHYHRWQTVQGVVSPSGSPRTRK